MRLFYLGFILCLEVMSPNGATVGKKPVVCFLISLFKKKWTLLSVIGVGGNIRAKAYVVIRAGVKRKKKKKKYNFSFTTNPHLKWGAFFFFPQREFGTFRFILA